MALLAAGEGGHPATERGIQYLADTQQEDGSWNEPYFTGTGFPGYGVGQRLKSYLLPEKDGFQTKALPAGFMINYHMYRNYWPLMALGRYRDSYPFSPLPGQEREFVKRFPGIGKDQTG